MYAIIEDGAHQYKVEEGDSLDVQRHELDEGQTRIEFDHVLLVGGEGSPKVGQPYIDGAKVLATIDGEVKGEKIIVQKIRRRKGYRRKQGHRQKFLRVKIDKIEA